eukprot:COSAG01_NODE_150_length_23941_cov_44.277200_9_plen_325_part_00
MSAALGGSLSLQSLSALSGGIPVAEILKKSRDDRRPEDLGIWKGKGYASLYLDDALTRALESNAEHRLQVVTFLRICAIERIPLGAAKAEIFCKFLRFLGMINGNGLLAPCPNKVVSIVQLERPWDLNTLQQFLGAVNWFRRHISDHAEIQNPLNDLTRKGVEWVWTAAHENAWLGLKRSLMSFPVLRIFDPALETVLYTDSRQPGGSTAATPCITPPNQTWHAPTRLGGAGPHLVPALRYHERRLSREWPLFWPGSRSRTCAHPAKHALSTAFAATSTPPRKGHLQAHQTAVSDAAPRGKASPTITLHEPGAGGGGEDRQADI